MKKKILLSVVGLVVVLAILGGIKASQIGAMIEAGKSARPPPITVSTAKVEEQQWQPYLRAVGSVVAVQSTVVSAEVPGVIKQLKFKSGQMVKKGDVLVQLDTSIERAQLASAQAALELAEATLRRSKALSKQRVNAPAELDATEAQARQAAAQLANVRAQLSKKTIRAPFDGVLGIREVNLGQFVGAGTALVSLQDTEQVYVDFFLPQTDLGKVSEQQEVKVQTDARPGMDWTGRIETIESSVDVATRNVRVRSVFDNLEQSMRPGLFVEVKVVLPKAKPQPVVPATSVVYAPYGNSIYVVKSDETGAKAEQVFVKLGERRGDFIAVESGLNPGQTVVSVGGFKLSNGASVTIDNTKKLDPELAPKPKES